MENKLQFLVLTIEEMSQKENRHAIKAGGLTYSFFEKKQDGSETRAFSDSKKLELKVGGTYSFGVSESKGEYEGKEITYRNIGVISEAREYQNSVNPAQPAGVSVAQFNQLAERVATLEQNSPTVTYSKPPNSETTNPDTTSDPTPPATAEQDKIDVDSIPY